MTRPLSDRMIRLASLGAVTGLIAGFVVLLFRWLIENGQVWFLPGGQIGNYEALAPVPRLLLPATSGLVLGWLYERIPPGSRRVGVLYVLSKLRTSAGGLLSFKNAVVQFFFGAAVIATGHSVDREGPGVHLGATCGSMLGQRVGLSFRDRRTLIGCGAAASIAAAFNTPLAGAVFGIEVLRFRYNIARIMPIILASVIGAVVVTLARGSTPSFLVSQHGLQSVLELPGVAMLGMATGVVAGVFTSTCRHFARRFLRIRPLAGFTAAGAVTGVLALGVPQIMGVGYDTLEALLTREIAAPVLLGIVLCKLLATSVATGFRVPGGLIGPTLVIGGAMGALLHFVISHVLPGDMASAGFYAIIGMVAMMGAALQAPLAALIALLELTNTPNIILPGMLTVVSADAVCRLLMGRESVFVALIRVFKADEPTPGQDGRGKERV